MDDRAGGGEGDATHFFLSAPTPPSSVDKYAFGSFRHSHSLAHSLLHSRWQAVYKGDSNSICRNMSWWDTGSGLKYRKVRGEGWKCSQRSGVDSKNIISDAKYCFLCVEKLTASWGWGMVRGTLWSYDSYRRSTRAKGFCLKRTWIARR